jgi:hypothetical protein
MKILIVKLVKNVPDQNLGQVSMLTLRPIDGAKCFITQRKT